MQRFFPRFIGISFFVFALGILFYSYTQNSSATTAAPVQYECSNESFFCGDREAANRGEIKLVVDFTKAPSGAGNSSPATCRTSGASGWSSERLTDVLKKYIPAYAVTLDSAHERVNARIEADAKKGAFIIPVPFTQSIRPILTCGTFTAAVSILIDEARLKTAPTALSSVGAEAPRSDTSKGNSTSEGGGISKKMGVKAQKNAQKKEKGNKVQGKKKMKSVSESSATQASTTSGSRVVLYRNKNTEAVPAWRAPSCSCDPDTHKNNKSCARETFTRTPDTYWQFRPDPKKDTAAVCYDRFMTREGGKIVKKSYIFKRMVDNTPEINFYLSPSVILDIDNHTNDPVDGSADDIVGLHWDVKNATHCSLAAEYQENGTYKPVPKDLDWLADLNLKDIPMSGSVNVYPLTSMKYIMNCINETGVTSAMRKLDMQTTLRTPRILYAALAPDYLERQFFSWSAFADYCTFVETKTSKLPPGFDANNLKKLAQYGGSDATRLTFDAYDEHPTHDHVSSTTYLFSCRSFAMQNGKPLHEVTEEIPTIGPLELSFFRVYNEHGPEPEPALIGEARKDEVVIAEHETNQTIPGNAAVFFEWKTKNAGQCTAAAEVLSDGNYKPASDRQGSQWVVGDRTIGTESNTEYAYSWSGALHGTRYVKERKPVVTNGFPDKTRYTIQCSHKDDQNLVESRTLQINKKNYQN